MDEIYLFGDQAADYRPIFQKVFMRKDNILLQCFLERTSQALREEITQSCSSLGLVPNFSTIQELVDRYYISGDKNAAIESSLVCISQLAHFIGIYEEKVPAYIAPQASVGLVGICTGLISAVTVAAANSLTALIPLAVEAVRIAFRIGTHAQKVARHLHNDAGDKTWSTIVFGDEALAKEALDAFHAEYKVSHTSSMWISAFSASSITISGPPCWRARLFKESAYFKDLKTWTAPIFAPYHANHLHTSEDIGQILHSRAKNLFAQSAIHFPVLSSVTGQSLKGTSSLDVLEEAVREILIYPIRLDKLLEQCTSASAKSMKLFAIGNVNLVSSMSTALKSNNINVQVEDASSWNLIPAAGTRNSIKGADVAIVGMSGRFPDAANHEAFWNLLEQGLDVHRPVPADRYPVESHTDPLKKKKNTSHTPYGNFIEHPGLFDARFFNMSPREAAQTDPMQRLMLTTAYEAMEMGGIVPGRTPSTKHDRIGTFYGQTSDDWREVNAAQDIDTYFISGGVRAFGPGRLNYFFKFSGPSFSVDTACSSSFAAMNVAITSLRAGECDTAITGGTNVLTNPDIFAGLSRGHFLSPTGSCKTWDNDADGYCRGDGVCTVIFKRLQDALDDNDPILGVIRGIGTNHSAQAVSITHPCAENQSFLFDKILKECNVDCRNVNYVEMHGTGTQAGDSIEMESVSSVFAPRHNKRQIDQPLYVGAVKSNIGHGEAVSGVSALIKVLLMLQKSTIPPHTGIKEDINKTFAPDLHERGLHIAFQSTPFPRPAGGKRLVFINNFSAAGGNTAMLIEDGPAPRPQPTTLRSTHIITISAKSLASFKKNLAGISTFIRRNETISIQDLAYTTTARRCHYTYRVGIIAEATTDLLTALTAIQKSNHSPTPIENPRIAFTFTGQGSQYTGIGKHLYETCAQFRCDLDEFDKIAKSYGLPSFKPLIEGLVDIRDLPPTVVQLGMCCVQMALTHLWASWGINPSVVIGHSLGEYAALQAAGVLSTADTIFLVGKRAALLEQRCSAGTHAMLAVRCSISDLQDCKEINMGQIEIACINGLADTVLSGKMSDIDSMAQKLSDAGQKCTKLMLPYAFHSSQVAPMIEEFETIAASVTYNAPQIPVISPMLNDVIQKGGVFNNQYLSCHSRTTVDFVGGLSAGMSQSVISASTLWLEIGSHPLSSSMLRSCLNQTALPSLRRDEDPWKTISCSISVLYQAGLPLNWEAFHEKGKDRVCLDMLPAYGFDEKNFWLQYTGDWLLYKGDFPKTNAKNPAAEPETCQQRKFLSTAVQAIVSEELTASSAIVVAESDLAHPKLWPVIKGHLVNGIGLCPSSLYADQALTLVHYTYSLLRPNEKVHCNVGGMDNPAPLMLNNLESAESQIMRMKCEVDLENRKANFVITSNNGKKDVVHAKSVIRFENVDDWRGEWSRNSYLIRSRIDLLKSKMENGEADQVSRKMAYKLFTALVDYSDTFQGMQSVIFDGPEFEAVSNVRFRCSENDGQFMYNPFCIDSTAHLSGFTVNATVNAQEECYISHGWSTLRILEPFKYDAAYQAYVKMQPVSGSKMRAGDVWIFDDKNDVVGLVGGLRFQCIPRKLMDVMMPKPKSLKQTAPTPKLKETAKQHVKEAITKKVADKVSVKPQNQVAARVPMTGIIDRAFDIIAHETAVDHSELQEQIRWADLGVDSLMSLTISGKFREELDLDIESSIFTDHASVGALRKHLSTIFGTAEEPTSCTPESSNISDVDSDSGSEASGSAITTPESTDFEIKATGGATKTIAQHTDVSTTIQGSDIIETIRLVISEEMEMDLEEIADSTDLTTFGMDSLMALTVLGKLREEYDIDIDPTMFAGSTTLSHLRKALKLDMIVKQPAVPAQHVVYSSTTSSSVASIQKATMPPATSVLLSGNLKTATKMLFLFPDGSGSATSYASIPAIDSKNIAVFGLNCPFMKDPTSYTCGIEGVSKLYLQEVMRRQPKGPWILGGWSAGGVVAYEVTRQIAEMAKSHQNDQTMYVKKLILIDAPCPIRLEPLPARLHHFFDEIGLLGAGTGKSPSWLLPHFEYSIKALTAYRPELKSSSDFKAPQTLLIWATKGVCGEPDSPRPPPQANDPKSMKWLLENRTDFGPNGWDKLLGGTNNCSMVKVVGNHFTMMKPPVAHEVGRYIREALTPE